MPDRYQLRVVLRDVSIAGFHDVFQAAMGWSDTHFRGER
jgi:hypothetical protein